MVKGLNEKVDTRTKDRIKDGKILLEMFNKHCINIVEKTSGIAPKNLGNPLDPKLDEKTIRQIIENYRNHPSIIKIKEIVKEKDINKIIKSLNPNKGTGPDRILLKIIETAANVIDSHLAYIKNKDLNENKFIENAKTALVRPIYKKDDTDKIKHYSQIVYPTSQIRYFPNLFQLKESLMVQLTFF